MKEQAFELKHVYRMLEEARITWNTQTKQFVLNELEQAIKELDSDLDLVVDINDAIRNHETVTLAFRNLPSGLVYNDDNLLNQQEGKSGNLIKYGGTLNFSFVFLGDVIIWMTYPYIREILENTEDFVDITRTKPDKLTREIIRNAITRFLTEMISWHTGKLGKQQRIGFATGTSETE
jgi:hypothetical protein